MENYVFPIFIMLMLIAGNSISSNSNTDSTSKAVDRIAFTAAIVLFAIEYF